ncbi:MAG: GIY-YIG nuclease family protein [Bifidobacteriaceae bacterium]|nr:GIY-YIG nuclease family protein [Bifidobacteriaceae bacterium]
MVKAKNINLYLMDGTPTGRVKCTLANWTGLVYRIPRVSIKDAKEIQYLHQTGVYLLFGIDEKTDNPKVYVGQAAIRKNGNGLLGRIEEHVREDWWNTAVIFTNANDSLGQTEISYLENKFYNLAKEKNRYELANMNEPTSGNTTEEKQTELDEYAEYAQLVMGTLGFPVFESKRNNDTSGRKSDNKPTQTLYCHSNNADGSGYRTSEGFLLLKGSVVSPGLTASCPSGTKKLREKYANLINDEFKTTDDIIFTSPSAAASFITGNSRNGNIEWKNKKGVTLKDIESQIAS